MSSLSDLRREEFVGAFDLGAARGLELGPFDRPVFPRRAYADILYADVKDTAELRRLARISPRRDENAVVTVDYVLADRALDDVVPHGSLDFVFCSHVLEHVPDLVATLNSIEAILRPGGLFLCAYPDRRFTFDIDRPATTLAQVFDRHARRVRRPEPETVHEHFLNSRSVRVGRLWQGLPDAVGPRNFTLEDAEKHAAQARSRYVDVHCNVLSDSEFTAMVAALNDAGMTRLHVRSMLETAAPLNEFFVALAKP